MAQAEQENGGYGLMWASKDQARLSAHTPHRLKLTPSPEESVNPDTTLNLLIEGDNLEALKLLGESFAGQVKMIYIDPPYNTGNDFSYPDNYNHKNAARTRPRGGEEDEIAQNLEASARRHANWLDMIYPRLIVSRTLLRNDGVIFISIGDHELANLKLICNEVFGEENSLGCVARVSKKTSNKGTYFAPSKDYILAYAKNAALVGPFMGRVQKTYSARFKHIDERGRYATVGLYQAALDPRPHQRYWIQCPDGSFAIPPGDVFPDQVADAAWVKPVSARDRVWRWTYKSYLERKHLLVFKETRQSPLLTPAGNRSKWNVYTKYYLEDRLGRGIRPRDYLDDITNDLGTAALKRLGMDDFFEFAKPPELVDRLITWLNDRDGIYLDFFAGSGTTAQAVLERNHRDGGTRRFILVELPEPCQPDSAAWAAGFRTIADIAKERIRRVIRRLEADNCIGFPMNMGFQAMRLSEDGGGDA